MCHIDLRNEGLKTCMSSTVWLPRPSAAAAQRFSAPEKIVRGIPGSSSCLRKGCPSWDLFMSEILQTVGFGVPNFGHLDGHGKFEAGKEKCSFLPLPWRLRRHLEGSIHMTRTIVWCPPPTPQKTPGSDSNRGNQNTKWSDCWENHQK